MQYSSTLSEEFSVALGVTPDTKEEEKRATRTAG